MTNKPKSLDEMPALLTPSDLATITGRSAQTIRRLMHEGEMPAIKIGRSWYCPKADFMQFLKGRAYDLL